MPNRRAFPRTARAATLLAVVLGGVLAFAAPAAADDPTISAGKTVTYTPKIQSSFGQQTVTFSVDASAGDVMVTVQSSVAGQPFDFGQLASACTHDSDGTNHCPVSQTQPGTPYTLSLGFDEHDLNSLVLTAASASVTVNASIDSVAGASASDEIQVSPQADLAVSSLRVTGQGGGYALGFSLTNHGPSGAGMTTTVVTGFRTRPAGSLPSGCAWSATATVTCVAHSAPNLSGSGHLALPVAPGQNGCAYRVTVTGQYEDPHTSNNTATTHPSGLCQDTAPTATPTPSAPPSTPGTPASTPPSTGPSVPASVGSAPPAVLADDTGSTGDTKGLGEALIGLSGVLVLAGILVAVFGLRRPSDGATG